MPQATLAHEIMTTEVTTFRPSDELLGAARTLFDRRWQGAPVMEGDRIVGVLSLADVVALKRSVRSPQPLILLDALIYFGLTRFEKEMKEVAAMTVGDAMTAPATTVAPDARISDVAALMVDKGLTTLPVVKDGKLVGLIGRRDIVALILHRNPA